MSLAKQVLEAIRQAGPGGITAAEVGKKLIGVPYSNNLIAARIWQLAKRGHVKDSGRRRPVAGHTPSILWVVAAPGERAVPKGRPRRPTPRPGDDGGGGEGESQTALPQDARVFWGQVRARVSEFAGQVAAEVPAIVMERLTGELVGELGAAIDRFQECLRRASRLGEARLATSVTRRALVAACHLLSVELPRVGKPVDESKAKRNKRTLVRVYHTDVAGGGDREKYEKVIEAYDLIIAYNQGLSQPTTETP